ncbi:VOC family protein [Pendulispora albinea]|uniref:VOC family protein n=1 Tax=Pendulispora albinea TaxID=2741071 RepID=A0ABZ2LXN5_9BACT
MPEVTKYQPGTFCWVELAARGVNDAKKFYKEIFAWSYDDVPIPGGGVYTMCKVRDRDVCALSEQREETIAQGVPPHWLAYISVTNADAIAQRAGELGGHVLASPFDVMDVGRMAILADPTGAFFALWQPGKHFGAGLLREAQAMEWNELSTTDPAAAQRFYTSLFGWTTREASGAGMEYIDFALGEYMVGGMMKAQPGMPSAWVTYFSVVDPDGSSKSTASLGGTVLLAPMDIPGVGRIAVLQDPQGSVFGVVRMVKK